MRPLSKLFRAASVLAVAALTLGISATRADAKPHHGHGHGRPVCRHAYVARPAYVVAHPVYVRPVYIAPPPPAYVVVRPAYVPPPPVLYAPVPVYDRHRDGIDGFIGISGPHVSIGIGF